MAYQIKAMRETRGWSQADLAKKASKSQSNIARLEDPDYGKFSIQTLVELADAFDVWLSVEFVSFKTGLARTANRSAKALNIFSFEQEMNDSSPTAPATSSAGFIRIDPPSLGFESAVILWDSAIGKPGGWHSRPEVANVNNPPLRILSDTNTSDIKRGQERHYRLKTDCAAV